MMEILFKDDDRFICLENDELIWRDIKYDPDIDISNIKHLDDAEVLYHYKDIKINRIYPVYYEHDERLITKCGNYRIYNKYEYYTKDYTSANLNLI